MHTLPEYLEEFGAVPSGTHLKNIESISMEGKIIVKKGTKEFEDAKRTFLALFNSNQLKETIIMGNIGKKSTKSGDLPLPFGCPHLEMYLWGIPSNPPVVGWFCDILGCICDPCRSDMEGEYPTSCPDSTT